MKTRVHRLSVEINREFRGRQNEILFAMIPNVEENLENGWSLLTTDFGESIQTEDGRRISLVTLTFQHDSDSAVWLTKK